MVLADVKTTARKVNTLTRIGYVKSAETRTVRYVFHQELCVYNVTQVFFLVNQNATQHAQKANTNSKMNIYAKTVN
jgi:hypothetical protein